MYGAGRPRTFVIPSRPAWLSDPPNPARSKLSQIRNETSLLRVSSPSDCWEQQRESDYRRTNMS